MDMSTWNVVPSDPSHPGKAQVWTNKLTGQQIFGHTLGLMPGVIIQVDPKTGERIKDGNVLATGQSRPDDSLGDFLKKGLGLVGAGLTGGALLAGGGGAAAGGTAAATSGGSSAATVAGTAAGGSLLSKALPILGKVAPVIAGAVSGGAAGDVTANHANNDQYDLALKRADLLQRIQQQNAQTDLDQRKFSLTAPQTQAHQGAIGDLLANVHNFSLNTPGVRPSTPTGGLNPDALGQNSRDAGAALSQQALAHLLSGSAAKFDKPGPIDVPDAPKVQQPGGLSNAASLISLIGTGASALNPLLQRKPQNTGILAADDPRNQPGGGQ